MGLTRALSFTKKKTKKEEQEGLSLREIFQRAQVPEGVSDKAARLLGLVDSPWDLIEDGDSDTEEEGKRGKEAAAARELAAREQEQQQRQQRKKMLEEIEMIAADVKNISVDAEASEEKEAEAEEEEVSALPVWTMSPQSPMPLSPVTESSEAMELEVELSPMRHSPLKKKHMRAASSLVTPTGMPAFSESLLAEIREDVPEDQAETSAPESCYSISSGEYSPASLAGLEIDTPLDTPLESFSHFDDTDERQQGTENQATKAAPSSPEYDAVTQPASPEVPDGESDSNSPKPGEQIGKMAAAKLNSNRDRIDSASSIASHSSSIASGTSEREKHALEGVDGPRRRRRVPKRGSSLLTTSSLFGQQM